jgi:peptidoglycan/LPS O-acetylase OafA/YrhL
MAISPAQSDLLNFARWFAAWLVVAEHVRALVFADYSTIQDARLWLPFYLVTGFGHEAVMIFFVISGYLVGGKVWSTFAERRFRWKNYFCDRLSRLYAVLIAAMFIGLAFDTIGLRFFNGYGQYTNSSKTPLALVTRDFSEALQPVDFISGLVFLQTVTSPPFGSNGPLWSLANEWWYYVLFPLCLAVLREPRWLIKIVVFGVLIGLYLWLPTSMLVLGGVWLLGVCVAILTNPLLSVWITAPATGIALLLARMELFGSAIAQDYTIGLTFAFLINSMEGSSYRFPFRKLSFSLADFSYSLYLLHFPLILLAVSILHHQTGFGFKMPPGQKSVSLVVLLFILAITFSWLVSLLTEKRTASIRAFFYSRLGLELRTAGVSTQRATE